MKNLAREKDITKYEEAFQYWRNNGHYHITYEDVGNAFNLSASRVCQVAKTYKWHARRQEELNQINEEIKRKNIEKLQTGVEFYINGIDEIFGDYLRQVLTGITNRTVSDDSMLKLLELSTKIQRGEYAIKEDNSKKSQSSATDKTVGALLAQISKVMMNDKQGE